MIYCGDFTFPKKFSEKIFKNLEKEFIDSEKIINFESTLAHLNGSKLTKGIAIESSIDSIIALNFLNVVCTGHANNHSTDFEFNIDAYLDYFKDSGISPIGLGNNLEEASAPYIDPKKKLIIIPFGWETIRCKAASNVKSGVSPYDYQYVETLVRFYLKNFSDYDVVLYIHWNYEFEIYPSPADREFSHHLIEIGLNGIFGHHPHIINCYEIYKSRPIFYSLGNFYFPNVKYGSHPINFKEDSLQGISVEYSGHIEEMKIYHHTHDKIGESMDLLGIYNLKNIDQLDNILLKNIGNIEPDDYKDYYKRNRFHKGKFLPIYSNFRNEIQNQINNYLVQLRQIPIDLRSKLINSLKNR
jgi:poly-gamma-glutamate synthesis protein (capsule biosynthesis protein)